MTAWGAVAENPTDPVANGGPVLTIYMNGPLDQLNNTLAHLQDTPGTDYEDRTCDETTPPGPGTPNLGILVNDGSASATNATATVVLRVERPNGGPTLSAPAAPLPAVAGIENDYPPSTSDPALFSVIDAELCLRSPNNRCGGAYDQAPTPVLPEPNDAMLLVMCLPEPGCNCAAPTCADNEVTWDQTGPAPTIAVKPGQANPTNGATVQFEVDAGQTFSSAPAEFDGADIDLGASTATTGSPTVAWQGAGSPTTFAISVPVSTSGDVVARVKAAAYTDAALNPNGASGTATVTVDVTPPSVTIEQAAGQSDPVSASPILFTAVFSKQVTGFASGDVGLTGTAAATTAVVTEVAPLDGTTYAVAVSGMAGAGTVTVTVPSGVATDAALNANLASTSADNTGPAPSRRR